MYAEHSNDFQDIQKVTQQTKTAVKRWFDEPIKSSYIKMIPNKAGGHHSIKFFQISSKIKYLMVPKTRLTEVRHNLQSTVKYLK